MIAKHVAMRSLQKSDFGGLVGYLSDPQSKTERVDNLKATNCQSDDIESAVLEVVNTQAFNRRTESDKTYHLIVSFPAGEQPERETLEVIEHRICEALGYGDHQRVSAVHTDTDHLHIHIAINKIHPTRHTSHTPYNDYRTLGQICSTLEREYGLQLVNHEPKRSGAAGRAGDMEKHAGVESLIGWINRECSADLKNAQSWSELHKTLQANGLSLQERGRGLVVVAMEEGTTIKASSIDRAFSRANLEKKFGSFEKVTESSNFEVRKKYSKLPIRLRVDTTELYAKYRREQQTIHAERNRLARYLSEEKQRAIDAAKRAARMKRNAMKLVKGERGAKKVFYSVTSGELKDQINAIREHYAQQRQELYDQRKRKTWADWLRHQADHGNLEALTALRARDGSRNLRGNSLSGEGERSTSKTYKPDSVTKKGTVIYASSTTVIRDDGDKVKVTRGMSARGLNVALTLASQRYGRRVHINGTQEFKDQVVRAAAAARLNIEFDDAALERRRQQLMSHFTNAKENSHDRHPGSRRSISSTGSTATGTDERGQRLRGHERPAYEQNTRRTSRGAPPQTGNRLPRMSELGMVQYPARREVLLPRDVPHHMGNQAAATNDQLRRNLHRSGRVAPPPARRPTVERLAGLGKVRIALHDTVRKHLNQSQAKTPVAPAGQRPPKHHKPTARSIQTVATLPINFSSMTPIPAAKVIRPKEIAQEAETRRAVLSASDAAKRYIDERESKRAKGFDILKHTLYTAAGERTWEFAGLREVEGHALALLGDGDSIHVMAVDSATANRLRRIKLGAAVTANQGSIRIKGRTQ